MSHLPLDARAILEYLNELGYRNISAEQLKEFMKDLRKLIKYEENFNVNVHQNDYFENLYKRTTASYRAKVDREKENAKQRLSDQNDMLRHKDKENFHKRQSRSKNEAQSHQQKQKHALQISNANNIHMTQKNITSENKHKTQTVTATAANSSSQAAVRTGANNVIFDDLLRRLTTNIDENFAELKTVIGQQGPRASASATTSGVVAKRILKEPKVKPQWDSSTSVPATNHVNRHTLRSRDKSPHTASEVKKATVTTTRYKTRSESPKSNAGNMISRPRSKSRTGGRSFASDPVALYHYYQREWQHFRKQIPGENSHSDLRWQIRHKFLDPQ